MSAPRSALSSWSSSSVAGSMVSSRSSVALGGEAARALRIGCTGATGASTLETAPWIDGEAAEAIAARALTALSCALGGASEVGAAALSCVSSSNEAHTACSSAMLA